jgi:hypothetical protein
MGDAADMILDGILDEQTGEYIGPGVGYPRTMERTHNPRNGVNNYLVKRGVKTKGERTQVIKDYLHSIDVKTDNISKVKMCEIISEDFGAFNKYCQK